MLDASFARKVTDLFCHSGINVKKFKVYIPRTWNVQLDDTLEAVIKRASKGFSFLKCTEPLQPTTAEELRKRGFKLELKDKSSYSIHW